MRTDLSHTDRAGNTFEWPDGTRTDGHGFAPSIGLEVTCGEIKGPFNNSDWYVNGWTQWFAGGAYEIRFNLYALVGNTEHPIATGIDPATLPGYVVTASGQWRAYIASVRGRVCDGFRLTITARLNAPTPSFAFKQGQAFGYAWGRETAEANTIQVTLAPNQPVNATIVAPLPLPVADAPATTGAQQSGTAPDNTVAAFAALAAAAAERYVEISADSANAGVLYVAFSALGIGASASAPYELYGGAGVSAGDSVRILIDNASKVFVGGSVAGQKYRVAVV